MPLSKKDTRKTDRFARRVYAAVAAIPAGCVASYGQLAVLAGAPRWARAAGRAMSRAPHGLPCHRVVNGTGRLAPGWEGVQRALLLAEGVTFRPGGRVDMKRHRWNPFAEAGGVERGGACPAEKDPPP